MYIYTHTERRTPSSSLCIWHGRVRISEAIVFTIQAKLFSQTRLNGTIISYSCSG